MIYAIYINKNYDGYKLLTTTKDVIKLELIVNRLMSEKDNISILIIKKHKNYDEVLYYLNNKFQKFEKERLLKK